MLPDGRLWDEAKIRRLFTPENQCCSVTIRLPAEEQPDNFFWPNDPKGEFSVKSVYRLLVANRTTEVNPMQHVRWKDLWRLKVHDRFKMLFWKVMWGILPTKCKVAEHMGNRMNVEGDLLCPLCGAEPETLHHLVFLCPYSRAIWCKSPWQLDITVFRHDSVSEWVQKVIHPHQELAIPMVDQHFFQLYVANALDLLWACRNNVVHEGRQCSMSDLAAKVRRLSGEHDWAAWRKR
ncbi:hypothetical protein CJ030_MR1G016595 [Morella rubra]|uniref:Reverse transcriptase zinc-binding domain-containing protein n=1 Tax=Morella rubra TaxID=262757 RepID=A0A6A1WJ18_9ROSI|nr:hypothetical protein CJ030_MR1G016595 [Morella rubra]